MTNEGGLGDYDLAPALLPRLRFNLFGFLSEPQRASDLWKRHLAAGEDIWTPPQARHLSTDDRAAWLAQEQAARVARARLWFAEDTALSAATIVGGELRAGRAELALPPTTYGMALAPAGLGYSSDDMRLIAACWSPLGELDWWITWWADTRELSQWFREKYGEVDTDRVLRGFGNLHYITASRVNFEYRSSGGDASLPIEDTPAQPSEQTLCMVADGPAEGEVSGRLLGSWSTLLGLWSVIAHSPQRVTRTSPTPDEADRDRRVGITPSKIHLVR